MENFLTKNWGKIAAGVAVGFFVLWVIGSYNGLVGKDVGVQKASADVSTLYQRRMNLIPNLVATVEAAGFQERDTLREVMEARASASKITIDPSKATPEQLLKMQESQGMLAAALGKLMVVKEAYPTLQTNQNFLNLQSQIEGTENRIAVALQRYNGAAGDFNRSIRVFPTNMINNVMLNFQPYSMFKEQAGAENAPAVQFKNTQGR